MESKPSLTRLIKEGAVSKEEVLEVIKAYKDPIKVPNRQCLPCTLCCKLVPVEEINKPKGEWCKFSRSHKGCSLHPKHPLSCHTWSCMWLISELPNEMRPDICHCVIDPSLDSLTVQHNETGGIYTINCHQIWVDSKFPDAWREGLIAKFIHHCNEEGMPIIIRTNIKDGDFAVTTNEAGEFTTQSCPEEELPEEEGEAKRLHLEEMSKTFQEILPTPKHQEHPIDE